MLTTRLVRYFYSGAGSLSVNRVTCLFFFVCMLPIVLLRYKLTSDSISYPLIRAISILLVCYG